MRAVISALWLLIAHVPLSVADDDPWVTLNLIPVNTPEGTIRIDPVFEDKKDLIVDRAVMQLTEIRNLPKRSPPDSLKLIKRVNKISGTSPMKIRQKSKFSYSKAFSP